MIQESIGTFTGAVELEFKVAIQGRLSFAGAQFSAAPSSAEDFTITLRYASGKEVKIFSIDPSTDSIQNIFYIPENQLILNDTDTIVVEYDNTDAATIDVIIRGADGK